MRSLGNEKESLELETQKTKQNKNQINKDGESSEESESVSRLTIHPHQVGQEFSFYEDFALRGIRVDRVEPGFVACTFRVPPRLTVKDHISQLNSLC